MAGASDWTEVLPPATRIGLHRVKDSTRQQYMAAFSHFARWLQSTGQSSETDAQRLDAQLEAFAYSLFDSAGGRRRQTAACARLACIWMAPTLRHRLPRSLAITNLTAWNRAAARVVRSHPPIPWPLLCVVAHRLAAAGDIAMAVAVLIAFDALLRVSEVAALRLCDIAEQKAVDARLAAGLVIAIRAPKTADPTRGEQQAVVVSEPVALTLLRDFVAQRRAAARPTDSLFGLSSQALERTFTAAAAALGGSAAFTWHSLRHGGATYLYMRGVHVQEICRWRLLDIDGVRRYVQTGKAVVASHGVDPAVVARGEAIAGALQRTCGSAPAAAAPDP